ncbi:MAG TPA: ATP-binding protein [Gaiellaceae bacterium]|jgi:serine/threonine-protein kinase RsbW|nr:ATP-binding protein [Gaiellaceae bacterium]
MSAQGQSAAAVADGSSIRLTIPAKPEYIALVRLALSGLSRLRPLSEETLGDLKLAVTEACSNSVRHGYVEGGEGIVEVSYSLQPDRLVVEVADDGPGFDIAGRGPGGENLGEGGLGIAIIKAIADEFETGERSAGRGSRLRFVKFLDD